MLEGCSPPSRKSRSDLCNSEELQGTPVRGDPGHRHCPSAGSSQAELPPFQQGCCLHSQNSN